jgi:hypothetical protein
LKKMPNEKRIKEYRKIWKICRVNRSHECRICVILLKIYKYMGSQIQSSSSVTKDDGYWPYIHTWHKTQTKLLTIINMDWFLPIEPEKNFFPVSIVLPPYVRIHRNIS